MFTIDSRSNNVCGVRGLPAHPEDSAEDGLQRGTSEGGGGAPTGGAASGKEAGKCRTIDYGSQSQALPKQSRGFFFHSAGKEILPVNILCQTFQTKKFTT